MTASYDVYIGRPSKWGNPFILGKDGDRMECIKKFREYFEKNLDLQEEVRTLRGKTLGCWCSPYPCHGDILAEWANRDDIN